MIQSGDVQLVNCGQQLEHGVIEFRKDRNGDYFLIMSGVRSIIRVNGRQYYMQPFTFMLHPFDTDVLQIEVSNQSPMRYIHLHFSEAYTAHILSKGFRMQETHTLANPLAVEEIWKLLMHATSVGSELAKEAGEHALGLLMCLLRQSSDGSVARAAEVPHYDKLTMLRHQIYLHPEESWFIQDICDDLGISRPYFHKLYLTAFGTTCTQDVILSRITCAKRLLEKTDDAISEVAQRSGFETDVYFMRQFKRHVGMTPTAYRRIYRQSASDKKQEDAKGDSKL